MTSSAGRVVQANSKSRRILLFADVSESTRLIDKFEEQTISHWRGLVNFVKSELLPINEGRFVKSLGDGLLLDFTSVSGAISTAFGIQQKSNSMNSSLSDEQKIFVRIGMEVGELIIGENDVYGRIAMLGARLMTLAGPGEIVISASLRDELTSNLDADIEDLGDCYIKHLEYPLRAYRIGPPGPKSFFQSELAIDQLLPVLAVISPTAMNVDFDQKILGDILATELTGAFSCSSNLNVISRLSTSAFQNGRFELKEIGSKLNANYVLSGAFWVAQNKISVRLELVEIKSGHVIWSDQFKDSIASLLDASSNLISGIAQTVNQALLSYELNQVETQPWKNLEGYKLLLGAVARMHRNSLYDFEESFKMLEEVAGLATRQSLPYAWMGKWYVLRTQQGWSSNPHQDGVSALNCTKRALDFDPNSSLALTVDGFVHTNLLKNLDRASQRYEQAVATNPNDSLAWLAKGTLHAFKGEGKPAVYGTQRALLLSPFDPIRYFYDSLAGTAKLANHQFKQAIELADHSLRANKTHTSTLRVKTIAQWHLGLESAARETAAELMKIEPKLTVSGYLKNSPAADFKTGQSWAEALRGAGIPE